MPNSSDFTITWPTLLTCCVIGGLIEFGIVYGLWKLFV